MSSCFEDSLTCEAICIAHDDADAGVVTEKSVMTACREVYAAVNRIKQLNLL